MPAQLWNRCVCEVIGTAVAIWLGQSVISNEVLNRTKGHGMGHGWISFGFGLAFGAAILLTGWVSANLNPAVALIAYINGPDIRSAGEFFAIAFSSICAASGGFLGGLCVFLQFWPHFQIKCEQTLCFDNHAGRFIGKESAETLQDSMSLKNGATGMSVEELRVLKADQQAKLLCFCTGPAIYNPPLNWLCEFMSSLIFLASIFVFTAQLDRMFPSLAEVRVLILAAYIVGLITLMIVGAGGPTGVAMNPARDFGPRLAHAVLPIRGKGSSEFLSYSWVPLTAPMVAAVPAAYIVRGINHLVSAALP